MDSEKAPASKPRRRADVVAQNFGKEECDQKADTQRTTVSAIWGIASLFRPRKILRPDFIARRKQGQVEEDRLDQRGNLDVELADKDPGKQASNDNPEAETPELQPPDQKTHRKRQEDSKLGDLPKRATKKST